MEVVYNNILLSVNEERGLDLYDKLHDLYFGLDDIEIDGVKGKKLELLETLPPLLHIQLQVSSNAGRICCLLLKHSACMDPSESNSTRKRKGESSALGNNDDNAN